MFRGDLCVLDRLQRLGLGNRELEVGAQKLNYDQSWADFGEEGAGFGGPISLFLKII